MSFVFGILPSVSVAAAFCTPSRMKVLVPPFLASIDDVGVQASFHFNTACLIVSFCGVCVCVWNSVCVHVQTDRQTQRERERVHIQTDRETHRENIPWWTCRRQRTTFGNQFFCSTMWIPRIKPRSSGLVASVSTEPSCQPGF